MDDGRSLEVYCSVIDLIGVGLSLGLGKGDLPDVVGLLIRIGFDQLRFLGVFLDWADVLAHAPTSVSDVAGSTCTDCVVFEFVGEFAVVSVVLHGCNEGKLVEERSPGG